MSGSALATVVPLTNGLAGRRVDRIANRTGANPGAVDPVLGNVRRLLLALTRGFVGISGWLVAIAAGAELLDEPRVSGLPPEFSAGSRRVRGLVEQEDLGEIVTESRASLLL